MAGPNGAGKSTYAMSMMVDRVIVIDPDRPASRPLNSVTVGRGVLEEVRRVSIGVKVSLSKPRCRVSFRENGSDRLVVIDNSGYPGYNVVANREGGQTRKIVKPPEYLADLVDFSSAF